MQTPLKPYNVHKLSQAKSICTTAPLPGQRKTAVGLSPVIQNVSVNVSSGSIVGIVGSVGSGKSSLLSAVTGDMRRMAGAAALKGTIGVLCQRPHVFNMTIRDNILFGRSVDESYYWKVLEACEMIRDIKGFAAGDLTEAGEKGEMLSGGQKQRVALARAVYSRSDICLLDDPTSSQDPHVARNILEHVIGPHGLLGRKKEDKKTDNTLESSAVVKEEGLSANKGLLTIAMAYIKYSGLCTVLAFSCFALSAAMTAGQLLCVKAWAALKIRKSDSSYSSQDIIMWLALTCTGDVLFRLVAGISLARGTRQLSLSLHDKMIRHVANSPLSFFDATPRGRIMNRFSVDLEMNDSRAFVAMRNSFARRYLAVVARLAVIGTQALTVCILACGVEIVLIFIM
ncbi:hypothetical protein MRX96_047780, partial [Rhipicephalus microplus]